MATLKSRIARLKALGLRRASDLEIPDQAQGPGRRREPLPGWKDAGAGVLSRTAGTGFLLAGPQSPGFGRSDFRGGAPEGGSAFPDPQEICFFDLETTGLSGGSGTLAFLAALGYFEGRDFLVDQVFLEDYPGEPAFLDLVSSLLSARPLVVTYNGAAFDLPLYRGRCILNGRRAPEPGHLDLLRLARRLWRRSLGPCSLRALEEGVLGAPREDDIPGFLIPKVWLDYSSGPGAEGALPSLLKVFEHNVQDVLSLARLYLKAQAVLAEPFAEARPSRVHLPSLALELEDRGRGGEGLGLLEEGAACGDQACLLELARRYRRMGRWDNYARAVDALDACGYSACVAKAKLAEHRRRLPAEALAWTEAAAALLESEKASLDGGKYARRKEALRSRRARLERKLEAGGEGGISRA